MSSVLVNSLVSGLINGGLFLFMHKTHEEDTNEGEDISTPEDRRNVIYAFFAVSVLTACVYFTVTSVNTFSDKVQDLKHEVKR